MNQETDSVAPSDPDGVVRSHLDFPVVGLGASAGGISALLRFFANMPATAPMAFVVVVHLSPKHESNLAAVLAKVTKMPVVTVDDVTPIRVGHVYVISPHFDLAMSDGTLRVAAIERTRGRRVAVDLFFRTLADAHGSRAFGIVLSGMGSDGAAGCVRIKAQGGIAMAQAPDDAEYDSMPRAAIETGMVEVVLPAAELPRRLLDLCSNISRIELPDATALGLPGHEPPDNRAQLVERALREILITLRTRTGHDFRHYKRATVIRRIERRMQVNEVADLPGYRDLLHGNVAETPALLRDMLIGVTNFFRDRESFDALERDVLPRLDELRSDGEMLRVWVAGCSTGEEAYSLAMLLCERDGVGPDEIPRFQMFATDIDERAVATARAGIYSKSISNDVAPSRLKRFFGREQDRFRVRKTLRERILFALHNVLRDPPFSKVHLISCRNLLIYLDREVQLEVLQMFHFALAPGGYLFLGSSESADAVPRLFAPVDKKHRIFRAKATTSTMRRAPSMPIGDPDHTLPKHAPPVAGKPTPALADLHRRLLELYAPPSVIVGENNDVLHISENAGRFLRLAGGQPTHGLLALVLPELRLELRTALFQARQSGNRFESRRVELNDGKRHTWVRMSVRPCRELELSGELALVVFEETEQLASIAADGEPQVKDTVLVQLEDELLRTKEQLQTTVEQAETSTEELKASNEELQAINEELRSASEELETSKEELQSINEELTTVNFELKSKVEETAKVNDDLQNLISSTEIATVFVDRELNIMRATPRSGDIFNIIPGDVGRSLLDITHRLEYDVLERDLREVFSTLRTIERELRSDDGRWYIVRINPYRTLDDRIEGGVLTFFDITGRRAAEEQVRQGEQQMRLVAESTRDYAIITMDVDGLVTSWNRGAERIFGFRPEEMLGECADVVFTPEDRDAGAPEEERRRAREEGRAEDERWHQRKDGSRLYCSGVMTPLSDTRLRGYVKIARDLTDRKRREHERESQLRAERITVAEARAANQLKDEFLAVMSHELKNPLNLVQINAEMLARMPEVRSSDMGSRATETVQRAVAAQARIIDDLLDLSRAHTGKLALELDTIDLKSLVERIGAQLRSRVATDHRIELELPAAPLTVHGDAMRIEQIVWNLLSNALKFTPSGGLIALRLANEDAYARIDVRDEGRGIDAAFLPRMFTLFQQADRQTTRQHGGLGIGLALVRELVELHGGRVEASSAGTDRGSMFSVFLPTSADSVPGRKQTAVRERLKGLRVLIVDDAPDTILAFSTLLELEGAIVTSATDGDDALAMLDGRPIDLLCSDIAMPGMDGYTLVQAVRKRPEYANLPAVALTGFGRPADSARAREAGFNAHLVKPFRLDQLLATLVDLDVTPDPR